MPSLTIYPHPKTKHIPRIYRQTEAESVLKIVVEIVRIVECSGVLLWNVVGYNCLGPIPNRRPVMIGNADLDYLTSQNWEGLEAYLAKYCQCPTPHAHLCDCAGSNCCRCNLPPNPTD
jgi:hypothetical protein